MNLGVFRGSGQAEQVTKYETWLGRPVTHVLDFVGAQPFDSLTPWKTLDGPGWTFDQWKSSPWQLVLSVAALPNKKFTLAAGARGDYDAHWRKFATAAVAHGGADTILRPMWENRVKNFPWYAGGQEQTYAACFRRFVDVARSVQGQRFRFDWCPLQGGGINTEASYPGDQHVDIIGLDLYDGGGRTNLTGAKRWEWKHTQPYGLDWHKTFASKHGKPRSFPEWGVTDSGHGGVGDDPYYVEQMWRWCQAADVEYANYFEVNARDGAHRLMPGTWTNFPKSAAKLRALALA